MDLHEKSHSDLKRHLTLAFVFTVLVSSSLLVGAGQRDGSAERGRGKEHQAG